MCLGEAQAGLLDTRGGLVTVLGADEHQHTGSISVPFTCPGKELLLDVGCKVPAVLGCQVT